MKYLIILILFITSCTDHSSQSSSEKNITITNTVEPIIARYNSNSILLKLSSTIYWNSNKNQYFIVKTNIHTNNISFTLNQLLATNYIYYTNGGAIMGDNLSYVGDISPLERIYTNSYNQQILQKIQPIDDNIIICDDGKKFSNTEPVYPTTITLYTNKLGEGFYRPVDHLTPLEPNEFRYKSNLIEI